MRLIVGLLLVSAGLTVASTVTAAEKSELSTGKNYCTSRESWKLNPTIRGDFRKDFDIFMAHKMKPVRGFASGLALRRFGQTVESKYLGEYWISRSLYEAKLMHIALNGFASIASQPITENSIEAQFAALGCINQILSQNPAMEFPKNVEAHLTEYQGFVSKKSGTQEVLWEASGQVIRNLIARDDITRKTLDPYIQLLHGSGAHEALARGLRATRFHDHSTTIREMESFLNAGTIPDSLKRYQDVAHVTMARALYSVGQFEKSSAQLKLVRKSANDLADSLSELSWAFLMAEKYSDAIGASIALQAGGLRHTFAPEAPMVMAMALNEICQYPESIRAVGFFRKQYEKPYRWLAAWNSQANTDQNNLYPLAVAYVKKLKIPVPDRIASEWVKSPLFISSQGEINLLFEEKGNSSGLTKSGSQEQTAIGLELLKMVSVIRPQLQIEKMKLKPGQVLPNRTTESLAQLKLEMTHFKRMQSAAPLWRKILTNQQKKAPVLEKALLASVNADLKRRTVQMLQQLEEIAENNQLVEVEIFNGASQDIIWQNAHPDYKKVAMKIKEENQRSSNEKTWNWGASFTSLDEDSEIWEDELGSFQANLFDNCSSKDRYLALRKVR